MKIAKNIIIYYMLVIISILLIFNRYRVGSFVEQVQYTEFIINFIDIISSIIIFYKIRKTHNSFIILPLSIILLFLMDIEYLAAFYLKAKYSFVLYFIIDYSWYVFTILGLAILLLKFVYEKRESYLLFGSLLFVALVIIFFFSPNFFIKNLYFPYYSVDLSAHITIFYLCILLIIATQNRYVLLAISGLCIVEIGDFAITECYLQNNLSKLVYGEFCFFIGLFVLSIGMLNIIIHKSYNPNKWFFNSKTIRNRFSFLIFTISIWSFIISGIVMKQFSEIENNSLVFIPAIGMFYSMITAVFSVIISKQMEKPFILIQEKIQSLFNEDNTYTEKFNLIEFQQLNNFIVESYDYKVSLEKHIISMATRIAHDIKSPLQIIENLIKHQDGSKYFSQEQLLKQINKISYISKSLLKENKRLIKDNSYGFQSLYCLIEDIISDKQIEWNTENSIIDFEYTPNQIIWLNNAQSKIKNTISNLLNNAFEASRNKINNMKLRVSLNTHHVTIRIQDYGYGINKNDLNDILNGKSLKIYGNGIGLSTALKFMDTINGNLNIESETDHGTTVTLQFPNLSSPKQFATTINITTKNIIITDDNPDIINFWQEYFLFNTKRYTIHYFLNFSSLKNYLAESNTNETTYLLDYSILGEKLTVVDIIKKFNLKNIYLITNYAEDRKLQDEIKPLSIELVPKNMLEIMLKNKAISCGLPDHIIH